MRPDDVQINERAVKSLADAIFGSVNRAYKLGGFGLAFLSLGVVLMLSVFVSGRGGVAASVVFITGLLLVLGVGVLFLLKDIAPLFRTQRNIRANKQLIDTVQATAIQLTDVVYQGQALAFKHAETVAGILSATLPLLRAFPAAAPLANSRAAVQAESLATKIVEISKAVRQVIGDVRDALTESNPEPLRRYLDDLKQLSAQLEAALAESQAGQRAANPSIAAVG